MAHKSIIDQLEQTKQALEKAQLEQKQLQHKLDKLNAQNSQTQRRARTRDLIQKGAILDSLLHSLYPSIQSLSHPELQAVLYKVMETPQAKSVLEQASETPTVAVP